MSSTELAVESPYVWRARRPGHVHRLICFPHAGAGAGVFADWVGRLPSSVEPIAVQLPGRQNRIAEEPFTEVAPLVRVLVQALRPVLTRRFSFFGHCGGAVLAFELARALRDRGGPQPSHLFLSGQPCPERMDEVRELHGLNDDKFRDEVVSLGGVDPQVAEDEDVMDALMPVMRDDFVLWERHRITAGEPLDVPIITMAGDDDPRTRPDSVEGWRRQTTGPVTSHRYPGGHFFFLDAASGVPEQAARTILASEGTK